MRTIAFWLSLLLVFVIPWENILLIGGLGTASKGTGLVVAAFWIGTVIVTGEFRKLRPFHVLVLLYFLWHIGSLFWTVDMNRTLARAQTYMLLGGLILIFWDLYRTPEAIRAALQAYVLGAYVSFHALMTNYDATVGYQRLSAHGFNANDVALILALGIPVAWYLATSSEGGPVRARRLLQLINYAYIAAAYLGILLTSSRAAFFATLPALLFMVGSLGQLKYYSQVLVVSALIGALFMLKPLVPQESFQRLAGTGAEITQGDLNNRGTIWREGIAIFSEHPILGVGSNAFPTAAIKTRAAHHNFVVGLSAEVGIIGFSLFATILAMTVYYLRFLPKLSAKLWLGVLMIWVIGASTHNWEHRKQTWFFLSLAVANASLYLRREESTPSTGTTSSVPYVKFPPHKELRR